MKTETHKEREEEAIEKGMNKATDEAASGKTSKGHLIIQGT